MSLISYAALILLEACSAAHLNITWSMHIEGALESLKAAVDDQEFLRLTRTALRIIQNILNEQEDPKYRTVRADCKVRKLDGCTEDFGVGGCCQSCLFLLFMSLCCLFTVSAENCCLWALTGCRI